jgi:ATP-dependent NAD(P)H-hydrate dehydratase
VRALAPQLSSERHKGQAGRVGVLGGSAEYTGAPFFAAQAALLVGVDLAHVFCCAAAAPAIKGYSPELIVHPVLPEVSGDAAAAAVAATAAANRMQELLSRLDCLVVGPGLGRDAAALETAERCVHSALRTGLPLVLDGDGIHLVVTRHNLQQALARGNNAGPVVLTPNVNEFRRLAAALGCEPEAAPEQLSARLGGAVVVQKGAHDVIACGAAPVLRCTQPGSLRRCGGQGDVLAGACGAFLAFRASAARYGTAADAPSAALAAYAACCVTRAAAHAAFAAHGRSMLAGNVMRGVSIAMSELAPLPAVAPHASRRRAS